MTKKHITGLICLGFLLLIINGSAWAEKDAFSPVRVRILETLKEKKIASISVAAAQGGKIIWEEGFGWADLEKKVRATPHTMYSLASISKPITSTGLMILIERGLVELNKPANSYLGEGKLIAYEGKASEATVKRILHHTAGLPTHWNFFYDSEIKKNLTMDESIKRYGIIVTAPGQEFHYANFGYGILDHIISRVSGKSYSDFMKKEVFDSLGMSRTSVHINPCLEEYAALRYDEKQNPVPYYDFDHRGASAVFSSAHDLVRFGMFHLKNHLKDQKQILKDETIDAMQQETDPKVPDSEYGYGWSSSEIHGYRFINHNGGMPGVSTRLTLLPSENIATVILSNGDMTELWEVELAIYAVLLPEFAAKLKSVDKKPEEEKIQKFSPPESLLGEWAGEIKVDDKTLPVKMTFEKRGKVSIELEGRNFSAINIKTPLGNLSFNDGIFQGPFFGNIKTADTERAPHVLLVRTRLYGQRMSGTISAVAVNKRFCLPFWIKLEKF